ncbi:MAG TPA: (2Fe-2S)-binding protein [Dehalococcoidia bacterium]|nr:(2Fe-2S)-binding protein [Dehalococcoidia bacterium]
MSEIRVRVNGQEHVKDVPSNRMLVDFLRYDLGFTGTKEACSVGVCGACTVLVDGKMVSSCLTLAASVNGAEVTTVEGLAGETGLTKVQESFVQYGGYQCGICTPGQVMAAYALLQENPRPTEEEVKAWMMGNLCRCTGYYKIIESVMKAAE